MSDLHGFRLVKEQNITELNTTARLYEHQKTGAQLLSMVNDDENKVFGINFRTLPTDSTGVPHILEHSVLGGSRKYPTKDPFAHLMKSSLNTFLNAWTFPDRTGYPVASQNLKDFYNLVDVYLDSVFYPAIKPTTLQQEGWHYEYQEADDTLIYKGIVFNEMKGAYSDPDNLMWRQMQHSLFPDTVYGVDSGGDPADIPDLTYEQFKRFHQTFYHPSNALIWFYGDDDPEERLRFLDSWLREFDRQQIDEQVGLQPPFDTPRAFTYPYAATEDANGKQGRIAVNWVLGQDADPQTALAYAILNHILVATPASPLRKALLDSGIGEDLVGWYGGDGLETDLRQPAFATGLKGIRLDDAPKVEQVIFDTLRDLVKQGIDPDMVEAAVNTVEFSLRENNTGQFPRGLFMMIRALRAWTYGADPIAYLAFEQPLNAIKAKLAAGERFFEDQIREKLLDNPHRSTVIMRPDPGLAQQQQAAETARLAKARAAMTSADLQQVIHDAQKLKELQETPDSPEALATLPRLELSDLDKDARRIPIEASELSGAKLLYHDLFTNGIVYLDVGFNLHALPQEYLPYMRLFGRALLEMGTAKEDYVKLSQRIGRKTGGIAPDLLAAPIRDSAGSEAWSFLRGKATVAQFADLLAILQDVLLSARLDDKARFTQILLEEKAQKEASLVPNGHRVVFTRLRARLNEAGWVDEQTGGIDYLLFLRKLAGEVEQDWPAVLETLETIRRLLVNRNDNTMLCNVTLDADNWRSVQSRLADFVTAIPGDGVALHSWTPNVECVNEGLAIPAQVNYVGKAANLFALGYKLHGSALAINNYLRNMWFYERIRVQGGAYGGLTGFRYSSGDMAFLSYRDPNLLRTLDVYDETAQYLSSVEISGDEVLQNIIGAVGELDAHLLPDAKGYTSMTWYLANITDAYRQQLRDELLGTTPLDFRSFAEVLDEFKDAGEVAVLGSQEALEQANTERGGSLFQKIVKVM